MSSDPTVLSSAASDPAAFGTPGMLYDPTVAARPPAQPAYPMPPDQPAGAGFSGPGFVPAVPLDAPTISSSLPGSSPYGFPPVGADSSPYGSTVYGAPSQPYPYAYPPSAPFAPPPPPPPPLGLRLFGPDADALSARPSTRIQAWLLRHIPLNYVVSKWFMGVAGALVALAVGLLLTLFVQFLLGNGLAGALGISGSELSGGQNSPENSLLNPSVLNFFALEHQVTLMLHVSSGSVSSGSQTLDEAFSLPTLGLLLVPALALTLGGYLAAASDFHRHPRYNIARGALIGPFYAILLLFLAFLSSNTLDNSSLGLPSGSTATISPSVLQECLFGLLWGTLFGALGGWIQLTGSRFLKVALPSLQTLRRARVAGALTGAGVALVCGILLFTGFAFACLAYAAANAAGGGGQPLSSFIPGGTPGNTWTVLRQVLTFGPGVAIWLFALGTGAPITMTATGTASSSFGFIGAMHSPGSNSLVYLLALGPVISYLVGGRAAARVARAQRTSDAFTAGALLALPLSLLLGLASLLVPENVTLSFSGGQNATFSFGPTFGGTFLAVLIAGAIVGGIGGASAVVAPQLGTLPRLLLTPIRPLGALLGLLLDRLTARPKDQPRGEASKWLYDSVLLAVLLGIIVLVLIPAAPALASTSLSFPVVRGISVWAATLLVGLPLLFLVGSLVTVFSAPPALPAAQPMTGPGPQAWAALPVPPGFGPMIAPPSQPFLSGAPAYGTGPLSGGMPAAPSQPFPPVGMPIGAPSQPFPPVGMPIVDASIVSAETPTMRSQPYLPGAPISDASITSADTPTVRSSQPYPPGAPGGDNGEPPARQ